MNASNRNFTIGFYVVNDIFSLTLYFGCYYNFNFVSSPTIHPSNQVILLKTDHIKVIKFQSNEKLALKLLHRCLHHLPDHWNGMRGDGKWMSVPLHLIFYAHKTNVQFKSEASINIHSNPSTDRLFIWITLSLFHFLSFLFTLFFFSRVYKIGV